MKLPRGEVKSYVQESFRWCLTSPQRMDGLHRKELLSSRVPRISKISHHHHSSSTLVGIAWIPTFRVKWTKERSTSVLNHSFGWSRTLVAVDNKLMLVLCLTLRSWRCCLPDGEVIGVVACLMVRSLTTHFMAEKVTYITNEHAVAKDLRRTKTFSAVTWMYLTSNFVLRMKSVW